MSGWALCRGTVVATRVIGCQVALQCQRLQRARCGGELLSPDPSAQRAHLCHAAAHSGCTVSERSRSGLLAIDIGAVAIDDWIVRSAASCRCVGCNVSWRALVRQAERGGIYTELCANVRGNWPARRMRVAKEVCIV